MYVGGFEPYANFFKTNEKNEMNMNIRYDTYILYTGCMKSTKKPYILATNYYREFIFVQTIQLSIQKTW